MTDFGFYTNLLGSLSKVTGIGFEIWNLNGPIFTSEQSSRQAHTDNEIRRLAAKAINEAAFQHFQDDTAYNFYGVPIIKEADIVGALVACVGDRAHSSGQAAPVVDVGEMENLLNLMVDQIGEWWASQAEVDDMAERLTQSFEDFNLYSRLTSEIKTLGFTNTMLEDLSRQFLDVMRVDIAFAHLPHRPEFDVVVCRDEIAAKVQSLKSFTDSLVAAIPPDDPTLKDGFFIVNDSTATPGYGELHQAPFRFLAITLQHEDNFYGWLGLASFNMEEIFRRSERRLVTSMAEQIAVVITNTDLYRDLERFVINMVRSLVFAIEAKDEYTRGHSERVSRFSLEIAQRLGLNENELRVLNWAAVLHDIGKIGIPEIVLNKPGGLDDEEFQIIKSHPEKGYNILLPLDQLKGSLPGVLHHHERQDGKGYPHGLKGDEIPLMASIIAVADTYDALTSNRAYRAGKDPEVALSIIEEVAGTQLHAEIVELFVGIIREDLGPARQGQPQSAGDTA